MSIRTDRQYKKSIVRNLAGDIIDMLDEADGGWIIRKGQIVNLEKWNQYARREQDKRDAAKAILNQASSPHAEARNTVPSVVPQQTKPTEVVPNKVDALEKKVEGLEGKLDLILSKLNK